MGEASAEPWGACQGTRGEPEWEIRPDAWPLVASMAGRKKPLPPLREDGRGGGGGREGGGAGRSQRGSWRRSWRGPVSLLLPLLQDVHHLLVK